MLDDLLIIAYFLSNGHQDLQFHGFVTFLKVFVDGLQGLDSLFAVCEGHIIEVGSVESYLPIKF